MSLQFGNQDINTIIGMNPNQKQQQPAATPGTGGGTTMSPNMFQQGEGAAQGFGNVMKEVSGGGGDTGGIGNIVGNEQLSALTTLTEGGADKESLGKAGGQLAGSMVGNMILPGIGGKIGGGLGSAIGSMLFGEKKAMGGEVKRYAGGGDVQPQVIIPRAHDSIDNFINMGGALEGALRQEGLTKNKARFASGGVVPTNEELLMRQSAMGSVPQARPGAQRVTPGVAPMQQAAGAVPSGMGMRRLQQEEQAQAAGGRYEDGGEVPIIAHEGEWILNNAQQERLKALTGMNKSSLFDVLGIPK